jgi:type IV pilus assembly protein PilY1
VSACERAIAGMAEDPPNLGQIKADIDECLEAVGGATTLEAASNAIYSQSTQDCWYMQKHPELWDTMGDDEDVNGNGILDEGEDVNGNGILDVAETISTENMSNIRQGCEKVYEALEAENKTLTAITPTDTGYACYGYNYVDGTETIKGGYVGRCWEQASTINCEEETCPEGMPETGAERICRGGIVYECPDNNWKGGQCKYKGDIIPEEKYTVSVVCIGETAPGIWENVVISDTGAYCLDLEPEPSLDSAGNCISGLGGFNEVNGCIQQALEDYCGNFTTQEVIDPSDVEGSVSGDYYNIPAILIETAVNAQLDDSLMTMNGRIQQNVVPEGILEKNAAEFRFGAMAFNGKGQKTECDLAGQDPVVERDCSDDSKDGARVISYLAGQENIGQLIGSINDEKATNWTPLAEAMFTAIGYYSQDANMRLNPGDFVTEADMTAGLPTWAVNTPYAKEDKIQHGGQIYMANKDGTSCPSCAGPEEDSFLEWTLIVPDPVEYHCQSNNVLFITEGSSTVDIAPEVVSFVQSNNDDAENSDDLFPDEFLGTTGDSCGKFSGSTFLDDLTWFGWQGNMWSGKDGKENYSNIRSWIVESARREIAGLDPNSECQPYSLLSDAAKNGSLIVEGSDSGFTDKFVAAGDELFFRLKLQTAFDAIRDRVSSGSAASVISASRSGEGALYQAIFWPDKDTGKTDEITGKPITVKWTGEVHAFLVDSRGILFMDDCKNGTGTCRTGGLDEPYDSDNDGVVDEFKDTPIVIYGDEIGQTDSSGSGARTTKGCPGSLDVNGEIVFFSEINGACLRTPRALEHIEYLWSTSDWLNRQAVDDNISYNRIVDAGTGISETVNVDVDASLAFDFSGSNADKRFIFTWNDLNNDGVVNYNTLPGSHEMRDFEPHLPPMGSITGTALPGVATGVNRGPVPLDFGFDPRAGGAANNVNSVITWLRGADVENMRDRKVPFDRDENGTIEPEEYGVWKLGDVIHSTPVSVSAPAENYHLLYRDQSYRDFIARWQKRRHMIYFGANDGMLHAVNGGFFDQIGNRFCRDEDCASTTNTPRLGAEMWAYVPYNLLPHLSCLTDIGYGLDQHKYFVDLRPRIFDVQIFDEEPECKNDADEPTPLASGCIHPNGWGTILVGGMRFGGSEMRPGYWEDDDGDLAVDAGEDAYADTGSPFHGNGLDYDNRDFTSAYFIFDITDPDRVPTLLGEFTRTVEDTDGDGFGDTSDQVELGYSTIIPTMVPMKVEAEIDLDGDSIVDPNEDKNCDGDLVGDPAISKWYLALGSGPTEIDGTSSQNGSVSIIPLDRLVSKNPVTDLKKDMRIPAAAPEITEAGDDPEETQYGTVPLPDANSFVSDMITVDLELEKDYLADVMYFGTISGGWSDAGGWGGKMYRLVTREECSLTGKQRFAAPDEWDLSLLLDAGKPITSSPTVGTDGKDFWVYFGTGRFFHDSDKIDSSSNALQTFYGIREPIADGADCGTLTWAEVLDQDATASFLFPYEITTSTVFPVERGQLGLLPVGDIGVLASPPGYQDMANTLVCKEGACPADNETCCLPSTVLPSATVPYPGQRSFRDLVNTISGTSRYCGMGTMGTDGWYRDFPDDRERNLGQATLFGALLNYTTYQPYEDICVAEGLSNLYSVYFQTGTAWIEDVFGNVEYDPYAREENPDRVDLGKGLTTTPSLYSGSQEGEKVFIQTSTGRIVEIPQPNLPGKHVKPGRIKWRDID